MKSNSHSYDVFETSSFSANNDDVRIPDFFVEQAVKDTPSAIKQCIEDMWFGGQHITELAEHQVADALIICAVLAIQARINEEQNHTDFRGFLELTDMPSKYRRVFEELASVSDVESGFSSEEPVDISDFGGRFHLN